MSFASPKDLRSVPSATGGIARLACARMRKHAGRSRRGRVDGRTGE